MLVWLRALILIAAITAILVLCTVIGTRRANRRREEFLAGRDPLSDDEFVKELRLTDERAQKVCCAIRRAVARELSIAPEMLRPSDNLYTLMFRLRCFVPDWLRAAREAVKAELSCDYDWMHEALESEEGRGPLDARTFGDSLAFYVKHLDRLTQPANQS